MSVRILVGREHEDGPEYAALFCGTTDWAFGPLMDSREEAETFLGWLGHDARTYPDHLLEQKYAEFCRIFKCQCGAIKTSDECESLAFIHAPDGCTCENNGGGDCPWCEAKDIAETSEPADGERFECHWCTKKRQKKAGVA